MNIFSTIDHVGIAVADLNAATAWYLEQFGMRVVHREFNDDQGVEEAMLQTSPGDDGARVQLLAPTRPDSPVAKFLERSGPGMHHIAYRVADIDKAQRDLRASGQRLLYDEAARGTLDSRINFVHPRDAGGVLVELVQVAGLNGAESGES